MDALNHRPGPGLVFLLWGRPAQEKGSKIDRRKHLVIEPAARGVWKYRRGTILLRIQVLRTRQPVARRARTACGELAGLLRGYTEKEDGGEAGGAVVEPDWRLLSNETEKAGWCSHPELARLLSIRPSSSSFVRRRHRSTVKIINRRCQMDSYERV